ncbi:MAG: hypothetical protein KIT87_18365 [Anaerolineae bacterium]|nr:hypothetical protein [Anaerolineae bacterium]
MTSPRASLLEAIARRVADYRQGEIPPMTPDHVDRWVCQFAPADQITLLEAMRALLQAYYVSREDARYFLAGLLSHPAIFGPDVHAGLQETRFLQSQRKGQSQADLLVLVDEILQAEHGLRLAECGARPRAYVYLDDCLFSGETALQDLKDAMRGVAPRTTLHLVVIAAYWRGLDRLRSELHQLAGNAHLTVKYWRAHEFYDVPDVPTRYDALWPRPSAADGTVQAYLKTLRGGRRPRDLFRPDGVPFEDTLFSSATARDVVERAFVQAGARLVLQSKVPNPYQRPLGYEKAPTLGFGAFFVTYRNCPNNCPLALWWGVANRWYPLFPRKINAEDAEDG